MVFFRLAGVFRGLYESSWRSVVAKDRRRRNCSRLSDAELDVESIDPVLVGKEARLMDDGLDMLASCECKSCGWTNSGMRLSEASVDKVGPGSPAQSSTADS
jgi:hypothetical protein